MPGSSHVPPRRAFKARFFVLQTHKDGRFAHFEPKLLNPFHFVCLNVCMCPACFSACVRVYVTTSLLLSLLLLLPPLSLLLLLFTSLPQPTFPFFSHPPSLREKSFCSRSHRYLGLLVVLAFGSISSMVFFIPPPFFVCFFVLACLYCAVISL